MLVQGYYYFGVTTKLATKFIVPNTMSICAVAKVEGEGGTISSFSLGTLKQAYSAKPSPSHVGPGKDEPNVEASSSTFKKDHKLLVEFSIILLIR